MKVVTSFLTLAAVAALLAAAPATAPRAETMDYRDLARRLAARRASLREGSIRCEAYELIATAGAYDAFRKKLEGFRSATRPGEVAAAARAWARSSAATPVATNRYRWVYRLGEKPRWRIRQELITDYAPAPGDGHHHREGDEHDEGVEVLDVRDMEFDGQTVRSAINHKVVRLRAPGGEPQLHELDPSLGPWQMLASQGLAPSQQGAAELAGRLATLTITTRRGQAVASESYEFDRSLGYAPRLLRQAAGGKIPVEAVYVCVDDGREGPIPPTIACLARFRSDGKVQVSLWIVAEWKLRLDPRDLRAELPERYELVDERFGYAVLSAPVGDWSDELAGDETPSPPAADADKSADEGSGWTIMLAGAVVAVILLGVVLWLWKARGKSPDESQ